MRVTLAALAACGGRTLLDVPETDNDAIVIDASTPLALADAAGVLVAVDAVEATTDALTADAFVADAAITDAPITDTGIDVFDAGTGICPSPPLLTGNGAPPAPSFVEQLALGNEHTCLLIDGQVWCWGMNYGGQLGDGTQASRARPTRVAGLGNAVAIASGPAFDIKCNAVRGSHTCALLNDATVTCWGANLAGETSWFVKSLQPTPVPGLANVIRLGAAGYSNCAVHRDGTASCWGPAAVPVSGVDGGLVDIAVGNDVFATRKDGKVWTWRATTNQGIVTVTPITQVPGLDSVRSVTGGWGHQCALRSNGTVWCWGNNSFGELGDGTFTHRPSPVQVQGVTGALWVTAGGHETCAILSDLTVKCWGDNGRGQLGIGTTGGAQATPVAVVGLDKVTEIRGGLQHVCARRLDGSVRCWGNNEFGQVGDGTTIDRSMPVQVFP